MKKLFENCAKRKRNAWFFVPMLFGIMLSFGCTQSAVVDDGVENGGAPFTYATIETVDIAPPTGCRWIYTVPEGKSAGLTVINSQEELAAHLLCGEGMPSIDFAQHTLLLAYGDTLFNVHT